MYPTPDPEVNALLQKLFEGVRTILGNHFVGMYLDGSLASGDFDEDSDIDFVVVTDEPVSGELFSDLQVLHDHIAAIDSPWAIQLEGSYISQDAIRGPVAGHALYPNIERGKGERLKMIQHNAGLVIHRYLLREHGITLAGPAPRTLVDPVSPDELRQAVLSIIHGWAERITNNPVQLQHRGYQSYTVLSLCRILYTLEHGTVVSKRFAANWTQETLGERWVSLIERAWVGRHNPVSEASPEDVKGTLEFIRYTLERGRQFEMPTTS